MEKKANHRERNKTRGKLIIDVAKFKNGNGSVNGSGAKDIDSSKDAELR
jgi:FH1/FH2 domain-containing protein 3